MADDGREQRLPLRALAREAAPARLRPPAPPRRVPGWRAAVAAFVRAALEVALALLLVLVAVALLAAGMVALFRER